MPDDVVDLSFRIRCRSLPADHAYPLRAAIGKTLTWLADEPSAGIHVAYGAESGNGWLRPGGRDAIIHLSRRARLSLRLPKHRVGQAMQLEGCTLDLGGHECVVGESKVRPLSTHGTLFARHLALAAADDRTFLSDAADLLAELDLNPPKMMSGLSHVIHTPQQDVETRSLMIDGLKPRESVLLQQRGLGGWRGFGCGIFLPHKSIDVVTGKPDE